nr:hypothetical protein [Tanacetum cinerariifolium]
MEQPLGKGAIITQMTLLLSPTELIALDVICRSLKSIHAIPIGCKICEGQGKNKRINEGKKESVPHDLPIVNPYVSPILFLGRLKEHEDEAQAFRMLEGLNKLKINRSLVRVVKRMPECLKYVKNVFSSKKPIKEEETENVDYQSSGRLCNLRFIEYHVAVNSTRHGLDTATIGKPTSLAALAVLVTEASQSKQHGKSEPIPPVLAGSWEQIPILNHLITSIKNPLMSRYREFFRIE